MAIREAAKAAKAVTSSSSGGSLSLTSLLAIGVVAGVLFLVIRKNMATKGETA